MTRRININQLKLTSHLALMPMRFWDNSVTALDDEANVVEFEVGQPVYFDGEELARTGQLVPVDGPGEPAGVVTVASVDRGDDITPAR